MADHNGVVGVVLAGGAASRLGQDKCALRFAFTGGEQDLLTRTVRLLRSVLPEVYVAGRGYNGDCWFPDDVPGKGPAGGVLSALRRLRLPCFALSVDLPFMDAPVLRRLLAAREQRRPGDCMTCFIHASTRRVEPLVALYEPEALPFFEAALAEDRLTLSRVVPEDRRHCVAYSTDEALPFFSLNYPADMQVVQRLLGCTAASTLLPRGRFADARRSR